MTDLRVIPYTREPITPLPEVYEGNSEADWLLYDAAQVAQLAQPAKVAHLLQHAQIELT